MNTLHTPGHCGRTGTVIRTAILEFLLLCALVLTPPLLILIDLKIRHITGTLGENSLTEYAQALCLLVTVVLFALRAKQDFHARGFYLLVTGFFLCMLIREHDFLFDAVQHGWWKYPALAVTALALLGARSYPGTVLQAMARFTRAPGYSQLLTGLVVVMVFSRVFGTGALWQELMQEQYDNLYKSVIQEGLELLGYLLIAKACIRMHLHFGASAPQPAPVDTQHPISNCPS
ncbi:hypothetical protein [Marinobacterium marinum]|uniref:Uncharacterized protein n=1 Tax=Marinobacterium marinum TaxID=2756129 RepID=A0A7W1WVF8_9GAMM|nr:hypothetical protein [Marinobacterium marinum]MBA4500971.1 hypothetical protein [Marinobacterium marinum]